MRSFPMFFQLAGQRVVIAGGGEQAAQKARLMLKTDAQIELLAPELDQELSALVAAGAATHRAGPIGVDSFAGAALVFVATGCPGVDACLHALAKAAGTVVNVVDQPALCDVTTPSIVDRDPVVVAIGTEGTAPVLARQIKTEIEKTLDPRLGSFAALAGRLRTSVAQYVPREDRRAFWRWAFRGAPWQSHKRGAEREAAHLLKQAITDGGKVGGAGPAGQISLVGAGPGARDLLTLRAVERLQEADVIFYDRLVDPDVLELARRDAERVYVGKTPGAASWPQEKISSFVVAEARKGHNVVRLKSGDASVFGRAGEEIAAAEAAGIAYEIVPGITAASGAAAALGRPLTERGETDALIVATGTCRPGDATPDWGAMARPGTTLALYMAVQNAALVQDNLLQSGVPAASRVRIVASATTTDQVICETHLGALADTITSQKIGNPAVILVTHSKAARSEAAPRAELGQS